MEPQMQETAGRRRHRQPSAKAAAAAAAAEGSGASLAGSSVIVWPPPSKPRARARAGAKSGSGGGGGAGGSGSNKRKGAESTSEEASAMEAVRRPCLGCHRVKLRCEGGYPCRRCFDRCIPCELAVGGKKGGAAAAATAATHLPSPTERVKMIMAVADYGSLSEIYARGIVRALESGLVCRQQALRVLRLWRASSQAAKSDVTLGTFAVVADRLKVLATELESVESLLLDRPKPRGGGGDLAGMAMRGMSLRQTHEFLQADGKTTGIFMWALDDHQAALAVNDTFRSFILGASEVSSSIARQKVLSALSMAFFFAPDDRESFLNCLAEIMFAKPPRAITNIFKGVDGTGEVKIVIHTMRSFLLEDGRTAIMHRIERAPDSGHINHRPSTFKQSGRFRAVRQFFSSSTSTSSNSTSSAGDNKPSPPLSPQQPQSTASLDSPDASSSSSSSSLGDAPRPSDGSHTITPSFTGLHPLVAQEYVAVSGGGNVITPTPPLALALAAGARIASRPPSSPAIPPARGIGGGGIFCPPSQLTAAMAVRGGEQPALPPPAGGGWGENTGGMRGGQAEAAVALGFYADWAAAAGSGQQQLQIQQHQPIHLHPPPPAPLPPVMEEAPPPAPWVFGGWEETGGTPRGGNAGPPPLPGSPPMFDESVLEAIFDDEEGMQGWG